VTFDFDRLRRLEKRLAEAVGALEDAEDAIEEECDDCDEGPCDRLHGDLEIRRARSLVKSVHVEVASAMLDALREESREAS